MRKIRYALFALSVPLVGFAVAQDPVAGDISLDPRVWFGSAAAFGAVIATAVGVVKTHVIKSLHGLGTLAFSYGLGVGGAVAGSFTPMFEASLIEAVSFGITAATVASGGYDVVKSVLEKSLGKESA